jgi:hypothetical protein
MAGTSYTRQSTIADGNLIAASLFNSEYNQIVNAFAYATTGTTGHTHDGSAGQGGAIAKIGDQDFKNKIEVSATNNRIEFYSEVGGAPVEQVRIQDGAIVPVTDSDVDLGTTSVRFKDAFVDSVTVTNNIVVAGTVDGRDVAADGTKLDGIEASATADQTDAEIRAAVEAATDSNVFTDADHTKLNAIEASADVTDTTNVTAAGALMDSEVTNLAQVKAFDSSDYATAAQGTTADAALPKSGGAMTGAITTNSTFDGRDVATDGTKLDGIEASADVTDATNVTAAGALMDSEVTNLAQVKAFDSSDYATAAQGTLAAAALPKSGGTMSGAIAMGTSKITGAGDPTAAQDVATKAYVDANIGGGGGGETLQQTLAIGNTTTTDTKIQFRDTGLYINSSADGQLDIVADTEIQIAATTVDVNGILDVSGNIVAGGTVDGVDIAARDGVLTTTTTTANAALPKAGGAMTGAITTNSTFDGRDVATDGTKLDGIEASADVTDATNVTAAGALMDSELTAIASVKALNQGVATTDSPAFAGLTVDTDTLAVDSTNNRVGIGSASPSEKLEIQEGNISVKSSTISQETPFYFMRDDSGQTADYVASIGMQAASSSDWSGVITFNAKSESAYNNTTIEERMRIDSSGNVGIGTASPSQALTVNGTDARIYLTGANTDIDMDASANGQLSLDGDAYGFAIALNADGAQLYTNSATHDLIFGVNEIEVARLTPTNFTVTAATDPTITVKATGAGDADADIILDASDTGESGVVFNNSGVKKARIDWSNQNLQLNMATESGTNGTIDFQPNDVLAMRITAAGVAEFKAGITEDSVTLTGTSTTIDLATATNFVHDLTGNTTYTFSNPATTGNASAFTLKIIQGSTARTITWPASVDWAGGTAPTLTATNNGVDVFVFYTIDGGTTYYGFTAGQAMA